jgi:hypothetical protein
MVPALSLFLGMSLDFPHEVEIPARLASRAPRPFSDSTTTRSAQTTPHALATGREPC